jgi:hypothetical protein
MDNSKNSDKKAETIETTWMQATAGRHQQQVCQRQKRRQPTPMTPAPEKSHSICTVQTMSNLCLLANSLHYYIPILFQWALYMYIVMLSLQRDSVTRFLTFFSLISFPQAPEYIVRAISNFVNNSQIYSQLKVHHRCHCH